MAPIENHVNTPINKANAKYRDGDFSGALADYLKITEENEQLAKMLRLQDNIEACRSRIAKHDKLIQEKIIIYSCLTGNYEDLKEPVNIDDRCRYILFTDNPSLKSEKWEIVYFDSQKLSPRRASRLPKLMPHRYLPEHDINVYIDASLRSKTKDAHDMVALCMEGSDIALYKHHRRNCVYDEIVHVMTSSDRLVENKELCNKTIKKYEKINYPKSNGLFENAFIFRRNTEAIKQLNELWWDEFQQSAERDQFTLMYALAKIGIKPNPIKVGKQFRDNPFVDFYSHKYIPSKDTISPVKSCQGLQRIINCELKNNNHSQSSVTVITPTGDRFAVFNKCMQWILTQTVLPSQWIIVDDGKIPLKDAVQLPRWATYIRRKRQSSDPPHTLSANLLASIEHIKYDKILIMEDDDWYAPNYIEFMLPYFDHADMIATNKITYYHLLGKCWKQGKPARHSALAQTGFTRKALSKLKDVCESNNWEIREKGLVDRYLWHSFNGKKLLIQDHPILHTGFKGLFGRPGIAEGHENTSWGYKQDGDLSFLNSIIGDDIVFYKLWADGKKKPFVVYTAISDKYDSLKEPLKDSPLFDFYVFSDHELKSNTWRFVPFDEKERNHSIMAKKPKIMPHLYFPGYQYSIFIDANIFILDDIVCHLNKMIESSKPVAQFYHPQRKSLFEEADVCIEKSKCIPNVIRQQVQRYRSQGFSDQVSLYECNFIVRDHLHPKVIKASTIWWDEVCANSERDQIAYPYALWRSSLSPSKLGERGQSVRNAHEFYYVRHGIDVTYGEYKNKIIGHQRKYKK